MYLVLSVSADGVYHVLRADQEFLYQHLPHERLYLESGVTHVLGIERTSDAILVACQIREGKNKE